MAKPRVYFTDVDNIHKDTGRAREIFAAGGDDEISGRGGNDIIHGEEGNDILKGGKGDDMLLSGTGDDVMFGATGADHLYVNGSGTKTLTGEDGADLFEIDIKLSSKTTTTITDFKPGEDVVKLNVSTAYPDDYTNFKQVGDDIHITIGEHTVILKNTLYEDAVTNDNVVRFRTDFGEEPIIVEDMPQVHLDDLQNIFQDTDEGREIFALGGDDEVNGFGGDDLLHSGTGNDKMSGGAGDDHLMVKGAGTKTLEGGEGADTFEIYFSWNGDTFATITDFNLDEGDKLKLRGLDGTGTFETEIVGDDLHITIDDQRLILEDMADADWDSYDNPFWTFVYYPSEEGFIA